MKETDVVISTTDLWLPLIAAGLATYSAVRALALEDGPALAFRRWREWVYRQRGFVWDRFACVGGAWVRLTATAGVFETTADDWIAAGVSCPLCLARWVGPALFLVALHPVGFVFVCAVAAGGLATVLLSNLEA